MRLKQGFRLIAYTLPGLPDPSIAIAASRVGDLGVLNLEYTRNKQAALDAFAKLTRYARNEFGVKLDSRAIEFLNEVLAEPPEQLTTVILTYCDSEILKKKVRSFQRRKLKVLLETNCLEQAQIGKQLGVDGVIAKGHEAGGKVGEDTTFILLQRFLINLELPVWAHGGVGLHTAAACYAAGAAGVVLDTQLALFPESPLHESVKARIAAMDGSETVCLGSELGQTYRVYAQPGSTVVEELCQEQNRLTNDNRPQQEIIDSWHQAILKRVDRGSSEQDLLLFGQDVAFAAPLATRFGTIGALLEGIRSAIDSHCEGAQKLRPLDEGSPLAQSHGTRYPIVQGPMSRISDKPAFALAVAERGGLPFLALSLMTGSELRNLLEETQRLLEDQPWGVGIIGFLPQDLIRQQMEVICDCHPPYALIAGGWPKQSRPLLEAGIPTYLHVPSPRLLKIFLDNGDKRFIFEGRESGGHVGPICSFVLWETMVNELLEYLSSGKDTSEYHVLFAGGIHDALSASMVAVIAAPLVEQGIRVGVQMGTAYLFTEELVNSGGIVNTYQQEALNCDRTVILEVGGGHANRCIYTPFAEAFEREKRRLKREGKSVEEIRIELEQMCLGRLNIASRGKLQQVTDKLHKPKTAILSEEEQRVNGMYLIGEIGAMRNHVCTIEALHYDVAVEGSQRLKNLSKAHQDVKPLMVKQESSDIAIIGMACIMPKAPDLQTYWENIINKVDAITEVPEERWDWKLYYDQDPRARDKVYSKWGAFLDDILFEPAEHGMPPRALYSIEPLQLLTLEVVKKALAHAGYDKRGFSRERTSVIFGTGGGGGDLGQKYAIRSNLPTLFGNNSSEILSHIKDALPEWTEDSFAGILMNVAAGRVANRFNLGGINYVVDAACASSLTAVYLAVKELETHTSDMVIVGGIDTMQSSFAYLCFSKTLALSPTGQARIFDENADGIVLGEGIGVVILKRLYDAERDGDRIYAIIKGVGFSSDGKGKSITAPRLEGQVLALKRAYQKANISPATVGLIEAHGSGTVVGDRVEIAALSQVFDDAHTAGQNCALGSVKSMIGHTKYTAGMASLIKAALALYYKILPPTLGVSRPIAELDTPDSDLYVNTETRPWVESTHEHPRRAGVSAFGFGGSNFHAVLEEYTDEYLRKEIEQDSALQKWQSELILIPGKSRQEILKTIELIKKALSQGARPRVRDLAYTLNNLYKQKSQSEGQGESCNYLCLSIVATSLEDLQQKVARAREVLATTGAEPSGGNLQINEPGGIYFSEKPLGREAKVAFLFPGQGSQYINMLKELTIHFPEVRICFERANQILQSQLPKPLSFYIFPPPPFSEEVESTQKQSLTQTNVAQPAVGAADIAMFHLLEALGVHPDFVAGHSYGEYVALCAAGTFSEDTLIALSEARGRFIVEAAGNEPGTMAAIDAGVQTVAEILNEIKDVKIANMNAPEQTVISGAISGVNEAMEKFKVQGIRARLIRIACAFHSPIIAPAREHLAQFLSNIELAEPQMEVFSNTTASPYPREPKAIADLLVEHLVSPVKFIQEIEALYEAGARIFVEAGPGTVLTGLASQILRDRNCLTTSSDRSSRSSLLQLHHLIGQLAAHGVLIKPDIFYQRREVRQLNLDKLEEETRQEKPPDTAWLVNGSRAIPLSGVSTRHSGQVKPIRPVVTDDQVGSGQTTASNKPKQEQAPKAPISPAFQRGSQPDMPGVESDRQIMESADPSLSRYGDTRVMAKFQQMMNHFLDTQESVMQAYLQAACEAHDTYDSAQGLSSALSQKATSQEPPSEQGQATTAPTTEEESSPALSKSHREGEILSNKEELISHLLQIVNEQTGYPLQMLNLDLDLEADLGIDFTRRVEILSNLQENFAWMDDQNMEQTLEKIASFKTLREIIYWIENRPESTREEEKIKPRFEEYNSDSDASQITVKEATEDDTTQRFILTAIDRPLDNQFGSLAPNRVFIITDDENGVAQALAEELRAQSYPVALVRIGEDFESQSSGVGFYTMDIASPGAVDQVLNIIRQRQGPIGGLIHLLPLRSGIPFEKMDLRSWNKRLRLEVKSLFRLAKSLSEDLKQASQAGVACLVAATGMGGTFSSVPQSEMAPETNQFFPGQGGITGLLKTIAIEYPEVRVKAIDLNPQEAPSVIASKLLQEMTALDGQVEVGYLGSRRIVLQLVQCPVNNEGPTALEIDSSSVILVTGGAQGITADVACELARRYQPTLLLVGRSLLPELEEEEGTAGLEGRDLKTTLLSRMRRGGQPAKLAKVEAAYKRLLKDREIRSNITAMRHHGAKVQYYQADVRDEEEFGNLIDKIYQSHGRLDGVIHGAGVTEDKLIRDKTPESFDRVFDTKAESAFILSRKLRPDSLKFLVFFSSVAGRFGNQGQCDYTAANEVFNKLAIYLEKRWPGRVVSVMWGPWAKTTGIVSRELHKLWAERGIMMVQRLVGPRKLDEEIRYGRKGEAEVVIGDAQMRIWKDEAEELFTQEKKGRGKNSSTLYFPLISNRASVLKGAGGSIEVVRYLDPAQDLYLQDHQLDGKPVLPMAMAIELVAEAVSLGWPGLELTVLKDAQVLKGVVLEHGTKPIRLTAKPRAGSSPQQLEVEISISEIEDPKRINYRMTAELAKRLPPPPKIEPFSTGEANSFQLTVQEAYHKWLFHGPLFQRISQIERIDTSEIIASLVPSSPQQCLAGATQGEWLIDPMIIDGGLQLILIWTRLHRDLMVLPSRFLAYRRFGSLSGPNIKCRVNIRSNPKSPVIHADLAFLGEEGQLLGLLEDGEGVGSSSLNRLAGADL